MSRTREDIQKEIIEEVNKNIPELTSKSAVAIWRLWTYIFSMVIYSFERIMDTFKEDVTSIIESKRIGTLSWYSNLAKQFQYNYDLEINEYGEIYYPQVDDSSKIVVVASSVYDDNSGLKIKVARQVNNLLQPLTSDQEHKLTIYLERVKIIGTPLQVVNLPADELKLDIQIFVSALLEKTAVINQVKNKINDFLLNIPFDGKLIKNDLINYIRELKEVEDIKINSMVVYEGLDEKIVDVNYISRSGYIILKDDSIFTIEQ